MIAISRDSPPAVFVASVLIHTSGIVLLLQYLFMRHLCLQCQRPVSAFPPISSPRPLRGLSRGSLSDYSITSDDYSRKRRRPYTTYGDGGEYINYLRRGSSDPHFDPGLPQNVRGDQTASGGRIPLRSPSLTSNTRQGNSNEMRRSRSLNSGEGRLSIKIESPSSATPSRSGSINRSGSVKDKAPERPQLRRTKSGSIFKENLAEVRFEEGTMPASNDSRPLSSKGKSPSREISVQAQGPSTTLRPVLLPPLRDGWQSSTRVSPTTAETKEISTGLASPTRAISNSSQPGSNLKPSNEDSMNFDATSSQQAFRFPFEGPSVVRSQAIEYQEDYADWKSKTPKTPTSTNSLLSMPGPHTWPVGPEGLIEPDPPFASEDRQYMLSTPSESRLSTITEEGTIRESIVQTPTNLMLSELLASMRESSSDDVSSRLSPTTALDGRETDSYRTASRLSIQPIPENPSESRTSQDAVV